MSLKIEDKVYLGKAKPSGGSAPVIEELNVTPTTSAQTITAPSGTDGYSPVNVSAVTSSIDANISAGNIKKDVSILGVTGSYEGVAPSGTKYITSNGTHDVAGYANADVQVPTTAPEIYRVFRNNNGKLENSISTAFIPLPSSITDIGDYCLYCCYKETPSSVLSGAVNLSSLTKISGTGACTQAFYNCTGITSVDLSNLTTISGTTSCQQMFAVMLDHSSSITNINVSSLTSISGVNSCNRMFNGTRITSIIFNSLSTVTSISCCSNMFDSCTSLTSISFPALTSNSFGTNTNQFNNLISGVTGCTIHFPSNLDPAGGSTVISTLQGYPNFSGTNTVLAFDLPATNTLTGADTVTYTRNPKYDTATALAWKVGAYGTTNLTPAYYTSGTTDPATSDTIYSDAACTTAVTTISSIA